ncbi:Co-activator of prophage gene expression IbrA [Mucinivorans hirudinis]|uniref:Co-activator of prophage gene expression IbrA n=1 Tax=Mucinivorans hirudinis TaxID=1433126 RepID=A0A060R634_9BACT|nr:Co-activator of prophage gene expression IbrA [Mucinivorans hirudinis]
MIIKKPNVYELLQGRLKIIFSHFDNVYVSFSGGKDSGVLLNMCIDYIRQNDINIKLGVFHMDYEAQYNFTTQYVDRTFQQNQDILEIYRICVPFKVPTCASMFQLHWRPWEESMRESWVRELPEKCYTAKDFEFFDEQMWDYDFQCRFGLWLHQIKNAKRTCCLVGIRTQESFNRWRAIHSENFNKKRFQKYKWTHKTWDDVYNAYPIFDWLTADVWTANGKFGYDYNRLYDLYYKAGVGIEKQRVASPFISQARESLRLYRVIDPDMWGRMIGRVNGVNFSGMYGNSRAVGWHSAKLPAGYTWESYMHFLLSTLPDATRRNYLEKLSVSIQFWRNKGGALSDATIEKLQKAGIAMLPVKSPYQTFKTAIRMEYLDDIDIEEFKDIPTFKRVCICILKNDHACKYMGFAPSKSERERRDRVISKYIGIY